MVLEELVVVMACAVQGLVGVDIYTHMILQICASHKDLLWCTIVCKHMAADLGQVYSCLPEMGQDLHLCPATAS